MGVARVGQLSPEAAQSPRFAQFQGQPFTSVQSKPLLHWTCKALWMTDLGELFNPDKDDPNPTLETKSNPKDIMRFAFI